MSCDAISAKAAYDQARDADWQAWTGIAQAVALVASLILSAVAARAAFKAVREAEKGSKASQDALEETRKMNAAVVRPYVAVETVVISFDEHTHEPTITLTTRNASDFTANDWEWQAQLKYRIAGAADERKSPLRHWGGRGLRGINLPPGDHSPRIPAHVPFPLNAAEVAAITDPQAEEGLHISLTAFTRCYDVFGNVVDGKHYFSTLAFGFFAQSPLHLQQVPPGSQVQGEEDEVPHAA